MSKSWKSWSRMDLKFIRDNAGRMTVSELATKLNRTEIALKAFASRKGISLHCISVSCHDAYLCRELYKEGLTVPVIAEKMELTKCTVTRIIFSEGIK